jgi:hypothetical protein
MNKILTEEDYQSAAADNGLPVAAIKAVAEVEAPRGGFDAHDLPIILFEGQWFSHFTDGAYDKSHPTISYPLFTKRFYTRNNTGEQARLAEASALDRNAALMSASWGKFQIMGFNFVSAGFSTIQDFVNAMYDNEAAHLKAFINFLNHDRGGKGMVLIKAGAHDGNWVPFAEFYNGRDQAVNQYSTRLGKAFEEFS